MPVSAFLLAFTFFASASVWAQTVRSVPSGYPTIALAVAASVSGDIVEIAPGTYSGPGNIGVTFQDKNLTIRSLSGNPLNTVVDCLQTADTQFLNARTTLPAGNTIIIEGLQVTNCRVFGASATFTQPFRGGAAIQIHNNDTTVIRNMRVSNNIVNTGGTYVYPISRGGDIGISEAGLNTTIEKCTFLNSVATGYGGSIWVRATNPISNIKINKNYFNGSAIFFTQANGRGGAIFTESDLISNGAGFIEVQNNKFTNVTSTRDGGILYAQSPITVRFSNNLVVGASASVSASIGFGALLTLFPRSNPSLAATIRRADVVYNTIALGNAAWAVQLDGSATGLIMSNIFYQMSLSQSIIQRITPTSQTLGFYSNNYLPSIPIEVPLSATTALAGNYTVNPELVDPTSSRTCGGGGPSSLYRDFHLKANSPLRNNGGTSPAIPLPLTDADGEPRDMDNGVDIGYDEFNADGTLLMSGQLGTTNLFPLGGCALLGVVGTPSYLAQIQFASGLTTTGYTVPPVIGQFFILQPFVTSPVLALSAITGTADVSLPIPVSPSYSGAVFPMQTLTAPASLLNIWISNLQVLSIR